MAVRSPRRRGEGRSGGAGKEGFRLLVVSIRE
jgi:hypothetical protein